MILPRDRRTPLCFAIQSGLRIETRACTHDCTRRCARNRRALAALLGAMPRPHAQAVPDRMKLPHENPNPTRRMER